MIHVLYLDDEEHNLTAFRAAFRRLPCARHHGAERSGSDLQEHPIEVSSQTKKCRTSAAWEFFEMIMAGPPRPSPMLLTGHADIDAVIDAINKGRIYKYISNRGTKRN